MTKQNETPQLLTHPETGQTYYQDPATKTYYFLDPATNKFYFKDPVTGESKFTDELLPDSEKSGSSQTATENDTQGESSPAEPSTETAAAKKIGEEEPKTETPDKDFTVINTNENATDGQVKCPKCGATDISFNPDDQSLHCNFCRHVFTHEKTTAFTDDLEHLTGTHIGSGALDTSSNCETIVTLKCQSCGAEVVIDTAESTQARCHWCRNTLSLNEQVPNGAVPDVVLPFSVNKETARELIEGFVKKRKFFAHPSFVKEFSTENTFGVYLPYMLVDYNASCSLKGTAEHELLRYTVGSGDNKETFYDIEIYEVQRDFDIVIDDLTIEASKDKIEDNESVTNNIINSIMPFDTKNAVKWNANYLKGFHSEKRDVNVEELKAPAKLQAKDVAKFSVNDTLDYYDRGVNWKDQKYDFKGTQWASAYLPVWLYSYHQVKGKKSLLHYTAVNGRTKEVMGSVPINYTRLVLLSILLTVVLGVLAIVTAPLVDSDSTWILMAGGPLFFAWVYFRYRNTDARHVHETETITRLSNLQKVDTFVQKRKGVRHSSTPGANNESVEG